MELEPQKNLSDAPDAIHFLNIVEFQDAALLSYIHSGIIIPAYEAIKKDFGIIRGEYLLLVCLSHYEFLTAQEVSRLTGRPRNTISRAVNRMLKEGYLKRAPDPADGRQAKLSITQSGKKMHATLVRYLVNRQEVILTVLDNKERKQLRSIMQKLVKHSATLR